MIIGWSVEADPMHSFLVIMATTYPFLNWLEREYQDKEGNERADSAADEGVKLHGQAAIQTGSCLTRRHHEFTTFLQEIHEHAIEAFKRRRHLEGKRKVKRNRMKA